MKKLWVAAAIALAAVTMTTAPSDVYAKRMGGGKSLGMKRQATPPAAAPNTPTASPSAAAPAAAAGTAAAAAKPARSWMGPIAGLAAGLGLAALFSSLGLGGELANFVMIALLVMLAVVAFRFIMRRMNPAAGAANASGLNPAAAGAGLGGMSGAASQAAQRTTTAFQPLQPQTPVAQPMSAPAGTPASAPLAAEAGPADFDAAAFERIAKLLFIRLQAANDAGQTDDLRKFTTPELFAELRLDIQERGATEQRTDVVQLDAQMLDVARENHQGSDLWVASVRFHGLIREEKDAAAEAFDEVWHFIRPAMAEDADWRIAGIAQSQN
ncbi:Tim44 domain-containing protein [Amphibiibacter pelophylacis]|uniref:Tim44-like domain-containing protein n=1 Tax=Amphibiibacter pelophylacis TaxID=1799477 RepID=A0ACC6NYR2_9BURK